MELKDQVCSLIHSMRLKELKVEQKSLFWWRLIYITSETFEKGISRGKKGEFGDYHVVYLPKPRFTTADVKWNEVDLQKLNDTEYSAFTVAELGNLLPPNKVWYSKDGDKWCASYEKPFPKGYSIFADNEADCRSLMLIHLIENGLI